MAIDWDKLWNGLNERQQRFLLAIYDRECAEAGYYQSQRSMFDSKKKGGEWRWIPHNIIGGLCETLERRWGYDDQGIGSTYSALVDRGHIDRKFTIEQGILGPFEVTWVKLTQQGRKLAKLHSEPEPPKDAWKTEIAEKINALLETTEPFEEWLRTGADLSNAREGLPQEYAGDARSPTPIARFLYANRISDRWVEIHRGYYHIGSQDVRGMAASRGKRLREYPLPQWTVVFAEACEGFVGDGWKLGDLVNQLYPGMFLRDMAEAIGAPEVVSPTVLSRMLSRKVIGRDAITAICAWLQVDPAPYFARTQFDDYTSLSREQALMILKEVKETHDSSDVA